MNDLLTAAVTEDEIKAATFQLRRTKAPGPDGLNGLFYQTYWNTLCVDFIPLIQQFFFYLRGYAFSSKSNYYYPDPQSFKP